MQIMSPKTLRQSILGAVGDAAQKSPLPSKLFFLPKGPKLQLLERIEVGSFYEIDNSKLPPRTPTVLLHSIRVVMVTAKTELNVTVRYPSTESLEAYFGNVDCIALRSKLYPALDDKFIMGPKLAVEVIGRKIPSREFGDLRHSKSFWLRGCFEIDEQFPKPLSICDASAPAEAKHGACFSEIQGSGWGSQRLVAYVPNPQENLKEVEIVPYVPNPQENLKEVEIVAYVPNPQENLKEEESHETKVEENLKEEESHETKVNENLKEEESHETKVKEVIKYTRKRKCGRPVHSQTKKRKHGPKPKPIEKDKSKGNKEGDYSGRWPVKRYEVAANQLLEVLKANGAVCGNPISRFQLRTEARKRIGDTGLLDHLLKHLTGKAVPGWNERLRRQCDPEGTMVYWLESADLINIRKEAGIQDPYWTPPSGWKPGDCIRTHDCLCCQEVRQLKEELNSMRRRMAEMKSKDDDEKPITVVLPNSATSSGRMNNGNSNLTTSKETYELLVKKKSIMEEQVLQISKVLVKLEEDMTMLSYNDKALENQKSPGSKRLPVEEMSTESYWEEIDDITREVQATRAISTKLKPCISMTSSQAVEDLMALTPASASPLSTTTS